MIAIKFPQNTEFSILLNSIFGEPLSVCNPFIGGENCIHFYNIIQDTDNVIYKISSYLADIYRKIHGHKKHVELQQWINDNVTVINGDYGLYKQYGSAERAITAGLIGIYI